MMEIYIYIYIYILVLYLYFQVIRYHLLANVDHGNCIIIFGLVL